MTHPRLILAFFIACLAVIVTVTGWVSVVVIHLDRRDAESQYRAEREENARLALWRMDSALGPVIAQENTRPYYEYRAFYAPPIVLEPAQRSVVEDPVVLPSPLLLQPIPFVKLHFQIDPAGRISSPQIPEGIVPESIEAYLADMHQAASPGESLRVLGETLDREMLLGAAPELDADATVRISARDRIVDDSSVQPMVSADQIVGILNDSSELAQSSMPLDNRQAGRGRNTPAQQELRSNTEFQQRIESKSQNWLLTQQNRRAKSMVQQSAAAANRQQAETAIDSDIWPAAMPVVHEGDMKPVWIDGQLLLVRRVAIGEQTWIQGCWLDWQALRQWLLQRVSDLLPEAKLAPANGLDLDRDDGNPHRLAMLPIRLVPGTFGGADGPLSAPIRTSLIIAWTCTLLAIIAVVLLAVGMAALSERRAAFVSAVTHELRTPLTTFRMYTDMLAAGMVPDAKRRHEYLLTLRGESNRLAQLVENVLSYARLERNRATTHAEEVQAGAMIDSFAERLHQRAAQAGMDLVIELSDTVRSTQLQTDKAAVEQILFNLVDNTCKYACRADDRRIHLTGQVDTKRLCLSVIDHGSGIDEDVTGRLFKPFSKSAQAAANSALGVGLGLALSRRLARRLGGDLRLAQNGPGGCGFELSLPRR